MIANYENASHGFGLTSKNADELVSYGIDSIKRKNMKTIKKLIVISGFITTMLVAQESTLTDISFNMDDDGNLNPSLFIPLYYGNSKQFYSAIGFTSTNSKEVDSLDEFNDSKNAIISSSKDLTLNYITYQTSLLGLNVSAGIESTISYIENNEFGYIHDSNSFFENGNDYYIAFDNEIELDIKRHAIRADVVLPMGNYITSRLSTSISPYTTIDVKQSTIFKPLVNETGTSSSSTVQDLAYSFKYELQTKTDSIIDIGFVASYDNQPLKYDIAELATSGNNYIFETTTIDINEITTSYMAKILFNKKVLGGLKPSIGYGVENTDSKDNVNGGTTSTDRTMFSVGFEKKF